MFFVSKLTEHLRLLSLGKYKKSPAKKVSLPRTNKQIIYPRCHLDSQHTLRRLAGYQHTPGNSRIPTRYRILRKIRFPVPSVVHLTSCFLPDSQHRGFSVKASLPLSPPQRFTIFSCWKRILHGSIKVVKQKNLTKNFPIFSSSNVRYGKMYFQPSSSYNF